MKIARGKRGSEGGREKAKEETKASGACLEARESGGIRKRTR